MIKYLSSSSLAEGQAITAICQQIKREFGVLPEPILLHASVPELLAASWSVLRETVVADGLLPRAAKELIAMAVSRSNQCPYCVDAHGLMLHALRAGAAERWFSAGHLERIADPQLATLAAWGERTGSPRSPSLARPPFTGAQAPEAIGTVLCFHYINRMVTILLSETPLPLRGPWLRRPLLRHLGRVLSHRIAGTRRPGTSLELASPTDVPQQLRWAAASPNIAAAFTRFAAVVEQSAAPHLTAPSRALLRGRLASWGGEAAPFGTDWLDDVIAAVAPAEAAAARLALLAALSPERIGAGEVQDFRAHNPGDAALVSVLAWGSFHAAERISQWLAHAEDG